MLIIILTVASLLCLVLRAFGVTHPRVDIGWVGLALFVATFLLPPLLR
jgi:hypothetical protein